jgi:hypothetical protein
MKVIDRVFSLCQRLSAMGWSARLREHGLDIRAASSGALATELGRDLSKTVDRTRPGFEDFIRPAASGLVVAGIVPGSPARSLLYHALASPRVLLDGAGTEAYPSLEDLVTIEDYVYASRRLSLKALRGEVRQRFGTGRLGIVTFAYEYREARDTPHGRFADLCFSRTGIARIGTLRQHYDRRARRFIDRTDHDQGVDIRVIPSRFGAFLAVQLEERAVRAFVLPPNDVESVEGASEDLIWLPLHKLFDGDECLVDQGMLDLVLEHAHRNEKLFRIHDYLNKHGISTGTVPSRDQPFVRKEGLVKIVRLAAACLVQPIDQPLVTEGTYENAPLTFRVPPLHPSGSPVALFASTMEITPRGVARSAPEHVHVRTRVDDGESLDLNDDIDVAATVSAGGYHARHYVDATCDGFVRFGVRATGGPLSLPHVAAYSILAAPDFFPRVPQYALARWVTTLRPTALRSWIWNVPPDALSSKRIMPNASFVDASGAPVFSHEDASATAVVAPPEALAAPRADVLGPAAIRPSALPDHGAGVFAPGRETSLDRTSGRVHLAAYGLGSPFPEDAKLCAASSSFWPAAAPDIARKYTPNTGSPSITPLTDEELFGADAFDGAPARPDYHPNGTTVLYQSFDHADFTLAALRGRLNFERTARVEEQEYEARTLAMARTYHALGLDMVRAPAQAIDERQRQQDALTSDKASIAVLSFVPVPAHGATTSQASEMAAAGIDDARDHYRIEIVRWTGGSAPGKVQAVAVVPSSHRVVYTERRATADAIAQTLFVGDGSTFQIVNVPF